MSRPQQLSQMNIIAILGSPLLLSFDLRNLTVDDVAGFANPEVIAVHQDPHPRGPVYRRLVGGPLAGRLLSPTTHNTCDPANPALVWRREPSPAVPGAYFLYPGTSANWTLHANHAWDSEVRAAADWWARGRSKRALAPQALMNRLFHFSHTPLRLPAVLLARGAGVAGAGGQQDVLRRRLQQPAAGLQRH
jgi:hypothetical protein